MYQWKHEYVDYNGNKRNETFYFNFTKAEIQDLEFRTPGGIQNYLTSIINTLDGQKIADFFKYLISQSYGIKDPEGRRFIKSKEILDAFTQTEAYSDLYMSVATDDKAAAEFFNGIFPKEAVEAAQKQREMAEKAGLNVVNGSTNVEPFPNAQVQTPLAPPQSSMPIDTNPVPMVEGQQVIQPTNPVL